MDLPGLFNYFSSDGINKAANIGTLTSLNPKDWLVGSLSDFNGKTNTEAIIAAQTVEDVVLDNTVAKAVLDFRNNTAVNEGYRDWHLPSAGELASLAVNLNAIQELLTRIPSSEALGANGRPYLSSTEYQSDIIWYLLSLIHINTVYKYSECNCRLIRKIE